MRLVPLLTSFHGRISRKPWWIGFIIWFIGSVSGLLLFDPTLFTSDELPPPNWTDTIWQLAWLVPLAAITVKRLNDRDWPAWPAYALVTLYAFYILGLQFGLLSNPETPELGRAVFWTLGIVHLLIVIDNGFFQGTDGPNRHGPDPLPPAV